jgi:hypothetical protein
LEAFELADAGEDIAPRFLEEVAFSLGDVQENLEGFDVLGLHFTEVIEVSEFGKCGDEGFFGSLELEEAGNTDSELEAFHAELDRLRIIGAGVLKGI